MSMTDNGSIPPDSNFDFKFIVANELAAAVLLNSWWMHTTRKDCLNYKPSSTSARLFCPSSWDFFNFLLLHPTSWVTVKDYFLFNLYSFTAYFYMQRYSRDHYLQLKLGDVSRIEIKN